VITASVSFSTCSATSGISLVAQISTRAGVLGQADRPQHRVAGGDFGIPCGLEEVHRNDDITCYRRDMSEPHTPLYVRLAAAQARRLDQAVTASGKTKRQLVDDAVREHLSDEGLVVGRVALREDPPEILTSAEAAALLRVDEAQLLAAAQGRELPGRTIGGEWRFSRAALLSWLGRERDRGETTPKAPGGEIGQARSETLLVAGLEYRPGDPVRVRVLRREHRTSVTDDGAAIEKAGRPPGWREVADRLAEEMVVNVGRHGIISLPVVPVGPCEEEIVRRIGAASLALYQELLELEG
jgi:hypothetical protein